MLRYKSKKKSFDGQSVDILWGGMQNSEADGGCTPLNWCANSTTGAFQCLRNVVSLIMCVTSHDRLLQLVGEQCELCDCSLLPVNLCESCCLSFLTFSPVT